MSVEAAAAVSYAARARACVCVCVCVCECTDSPGSIQSRSFIPLARPIAFVYFGPIVYSHDDNNAYSLATRGSTEVNARFSLVVNGSRQTGEVGAY